jgi:hypothetical protein
MNHLRLTPLVFKRMAMPALVLSTLAACGGGSDAPTTANDAIEQPQAVSTTWTYLTGEGRGFNVPAQTVVRYGADTRWVSKTVSGAGQCTNAFFGHDPAYGIGKTCQKATVSTVAGGYGDFRVAALGINANLNGAVAFPSDNAWNRNVSAAPRDPNSDALIASIGLDRGIHPDFGAGTYNGQPMGIPYVVVGANQAKVPIVWTAYGNESEPGPYPVPSNAPVEGGASSTGDRHVLVIDRDNSRLYELYRAFKRSDGGWQADSGAVFHLDSNTVRPGGQPGWTSADAAGLPIFPGLVRYEEAARGPGGIGHALRFTIQRSRKAFVPPATHSASSSTDLNLPPMGMRVRLKANYVIPATFSAETKSILTAMKTYGMLVADNGSDWYVSGAPDDRWNNDRLVSELAQVKGGSFEVVRMDG